MCSAPAVHHRQKRQLIGRNTYSPAFEQNRHNIAANPGLYKRRQVIVEHPFGTIKRQWGYSYVLTKKGMERALADVGLMLVAYNLCRILSIVCQSVCGLLKRAVDFGFYDWGTMAKLQTMQKKLRL